MITTSNVSRPALLLVAFILAATPLAAQNDTLRLLPNPGDHARLDPNGFLFNPKWLNGALRPNIDELCGFRAVTGALEIRRLVTISDRNCLTQRERRIVSLNEASSNLILGLVCQTSDRIGRVRGHVNWVPATATGQLQFEEYSGDPPMDGDININITTVDSFALTSGNHGMKPPFASRKGLHTESYYQETLARLRDRNDGWWHALRGGIKDNARMGELVDGRFAIVTGLYGVDGVHRFQAELHPVFAMAVLLTLDPVAKTEEWALMVRNQGNEGDCGTGRHAMNTLHDGERGTAHGDHVDQDYVVDLGWWSPADGASVAMNSGWSTDGDHPPAYFAQGQHLYVVLRHPRPEIGQRDFLFLGTINLTWSSQQTAALSVDRFDAWLPAGHPPINVSPFKPRKDGPPIKQERPDSLIALPIVPLIRLTTPPATRAEVLAEPNVPFPLHDSVGKDCQRGPDAWKRLITGFCQNAVRVVIGSSRNIGHAWFGSLYIYPNTWSLHWDNGLGEFLSYFSVLGYRLDYRPNDRFRLMPDSVHPVGDVFQGRTIRLSAILSPTTAHINSDLQITPYTIGSLGMSRVKSPAGLRITEPMWSWGLGMQFNSRGTEFFIEGQHQLLHGKTRKDGFGREIGGFEGHFALSAGILFCVWPLCK
jgi:hypothetical protein